MKEKDYYPRKIDEKLKEWKKGLTREKTILLLGGARRTGKTEALSHFGQSSFSRYDIIKVQDLSKDELDQLTKKGDVKKNFVDYMLPRNFSEADLNGDVLIIFDEIQEHNELKTVISKLNEVFQCCFACTGSAMWINSSDEERPLPGFYPMTMHPFTFDEFLSAIGGRDVWLKEKANLHTKTPIRENKELAKLYKTYIVVGGMPQAIAEYISNRSNSTQCFSLVDSIKRRDILNVYQADFEKYDKIKKWKLEDRYNFLKTMISKMVVVEEEDKIDDYSRMNNSNVMLLFYDLCELNEKPSLSFSTSRFKPFFLDTGVYFTYLLSSFREEDVHKKYIDFINNDDDDNNGPIWENVVASTIASYDYGKFFKFIKRNPESKREEERENDHELDFVLSGKDGIVALEAKSGKNKQHKSLKLGMEKYQNISKSFVLGQSYIPSNANQKEAYIPFYALELLLGE